jgi:hypothetical protein
MGNATNIWGTTVVSIAATLELFCAASDEGRELLSLGEAQVVEYAEKQFTGASMDESIDWAGI